MEVPVKEMYDIGETYSIRYGDYIRTYGIYKEKGKDGNYHDCHVELRRVFKPEQLDPKVLLKERDLEIKELEDKIRHLETEQKMIAYFTQKHTKT